MNGEPIEFCDRYTGEIQTEKVFGDQLLRWVYEKPSGRFFCHLLVKRRKFSQAYGWWANGSWTRKQISSFIEEFDIDTAEFLRPKEELRSFNEFFKRELKPESRPISPGDDVVVCPADGRHLGYQSIESVSSIYAKGQKFNLLELLKDPHLESRYRNGSLVISRLCPVDYHRYHFPVSGTVASSTQINGHLFSVNPVALKKQIEILNQNKRVKTELKSERFGSILILEIGATNVGSIRQTFSANSQVEKGEEKGYFEFGGSMVITLFENGAVDLDKDLVENTKQGRELYIKMGDRIATSR